MTHLPLYLAQFFSGVVWVTLGPLLDSVHHQYLATVRPMHLQFVEPSKRYADIVIPEGYNTGAVGTVISMIREVLRSR